MASPTKQLENIRASKKAKAGAWRKNQVRRAGTTAKLLPLNAPNANEKAQRKA